jgi:hypothetical protein
VVITCLAAFATPVSADNSQGNINKHEQTIVQSEPGSARSVWEKHTKQRAPFGIVKGPMKQRAPLSPVKGLMKEQPTSNLNHKFNCCDYSLSYRHTYDHHSNDIPRSVIPETPAPSPTPLFIL